LGMALFLMFGPKPTLTITKEFVIATSYFGKKLFLPISQISVIGTGFFKRITIATSKGTVNFYQVENRDKIIDFLSEHITRLQNKNSTPSE